jgi:two-component system, OmpR family, phosphate regulon sensor histidine kinase PhoR
LKKESFIIAIGAALCVTIVLFIIGNFYPALSLPDSLIIVFCICLGVVYFLYYLMVGQRLKKIRGLMERETQTKNISLKDLEAKLYKLLEERKEELETIEKLERHRREYLGNVSHEMKTPLFHMQGYISTLSDNETYDEELFKRYLERTEKSIERLIRILEDLDTISQLESREIVAEVEPFDIVELSKEVLESEELNAEKKNIKFDLQAENEKMMVIGDRFRIRQVLLNLVVNSIRYGKKDGETRIRIKNAGDMVSIEVADNGIGIGAEHLPRLFERFYRVDKSRSREQGGTGLGLSIVKHILEAHHQTIQVMSTEGAGSVFTFNMKKSNGNGNGHSHA